MGYQDIELDRTLSYELNSGHLGGEVEGPGFVARVADGPIATSLPETLTAAGKAIPKTLSLYERFGVWIVPHRLAIIRRKGLAEPVAVGVQIQYVVDGTCSILGLFPSFEYRVVGEIGGNFHAELGASGEIGAALSPDVAGVDSSSVGANLGSLKVGIRTGATIGLDLSCSVSTSIISASGVGSRECEWRFDRDKEPLVGRDIETWAIIAASQWQTNLAYRMKFYVISRLIVPMRTESDWVNVDCLLAPREKASAGG